VPDRRAGCRGSAHARRNWLQVERHRTTLLGPQHDEQAEVTTSNFIMFQFEAAGLTVVFRDLQEMLPIQIPKLGREERIVGQPLTNIACETDIFRLVQLNYVPPQMRYFHHYE
jgi:hypothetical protein